jgi:putative glutamine amidotransferase
MSKTASSLRIGIYGCDAQVNQPSKSFGLWGPGYASSVTAAGATPVALRPMPGCSWDELLEGIDGVVFAASKATGARQQAEEERLCEWCRELRLPFLGVDQGLHVLNTTYGGTLYADLYREMPEALQHRQPPEPGVRHAIAVVEGTRLSKLYGEGEIVVNSEHRRAVNRVARGFRISARALDGVIEAIEAEDEGWFGVGVQWHPASASASGLDIQLFRGLIDACGSRQQRRSRHAEPVAA